MDQMAEHMRISLIDPKFKQQRDAMMAKLRNSTMAQDDEIGRNIMRLAKTRPDVFASTDEELGIALKGEADATKKLLEESGPGPQGVPFQMIQNTTGTRARAQWRCFLCIRIALRGGECCYQCVRIQWCLEAR